MRILHFIHTKRGHWSDPCEQMPARCTLLSHLPVHTGPFSMERRNRGSEHTNHRRSNQNATPPCTLTFDRAIHYFPKQARWQMLLSRDHDSSDGRGKFHPHVHHPLDDVVVVRRTDEIQFYNVRGLRNFGNDIRLSRRSTDRKTVQGGWHLPLTLI